MTKESTILCSGRFELPTYKMCVPQPPCYLTKNNDTIEKIITNIPLKLQKDIFFLSDI